MPFADQVNNIHATCLQQLDPTNHMAPPWYRIGDSGLRCESPQPYLVARGVLTKFVTSRHRHCK
eukprot:2529757-Amphidinium_carterae.1